VLRRRFLAGFGSSVAAAAVQTERAHASDFPSRTVELVVGFPPGGGTDMVARSFADAARRHAPQPFVVVNRPGASGALALADVLAARPDGHRVALVTSELAILPALNQVRFSVDDFTYIARLNADPSVLFVRADSPFATLEDFTAEARRRPGQIRAADAGVGSIFHLATAAWAERAAVEVNHVPFQGSAPGLVALLGGHVDSMTTGPAEGGQHVAGGRLRALAVMADARHPTFPDVPTLKERGVDLSIGVWRGLGVRRDTPAAVSAALAEIARAVAADQGFREAMARGNQTLAFADGPDFAALVNQDRTLFQGLVPRLRLG
jgi:tripartite-type tricarboxylate transporter receptor subunit TctC